MEQFEFRGQKPGAGRGLNAAEGGEHPTPDAPVMILLVEDNEDNRAVYTTILRYYGFQVVEAPSGEEGVELARRLQPGLILMDVGLPGIDGWEATRRIKGDPETQAIPVIALTAHAMAEHRAASFAAGCDGYLAKPIEPRDVLAEVRRFLAPADHLSA